MEPDYNRKPPHLWGKKQLETHYTTVSDERPGLFSARCFLFFCFFFSVLPPGFGRCPRRRYPFRRRASRCPLVSCASLAPRPHGSTGMACRLPRPHEGAALSETHPASPPAAGRAEGARAPGAPTGWTGVSAGPPPPDVPTGLAPRLSVSRRHPSSCRPCSHLACARVQGTKSFAAH